MRINPEDKAKIIRQAKHRLGSPLRKIQIENEQFDTFIEIATEDYVEYIQNFLIESQWPNLIGLNVNESDLARAFIMRGTDLITQYTYSYSKIVGLGAGEGGYELKKDFIELKSNVQMYEIPKNREINEVMYHTPAALNQAVIDPVMGMWAFGFGGQGSGAYSGLGGNYILPAFDMLLRTADRGLKNRLIRSELIYKITNGPNGTKFLHLMNVPGGTYDFGGGVLNMGKVWYWYYDINGNKKDCLDKNKDIIKTPSDVPLDDLSFDDLNDPSKVWIRRYFIAICKETLGRTRGTFGGKIPIPDGMAEMEYQSLLTEGKDEMMVLKTELNDRLMRYNPLEMVKRVSEEAKYVNDTLKFRAMPSPIRAI